MNNQELFNWFRNLSKQNTFDVELALKNKANIKLYKQSLFYKQTKYSIKKAYGLYLTTPLSTMINFVNTDLFIELSKGNYFYAIGLAQDLVESFDVTKLDRIIDYLTNKLTNIDFNNLSNQLNDAIKELNLNKINLK